MGSLVHELQQLASDGQASVSNLLRKALIVSEKLDLQSTTSWIQHELDGYPEHVDLPMYRMCVGTLVYKSELSGTIFDKLDGNDMELLTFRVWLNRKSVADLEVYLKHTPKDTLNPYSEEIAEQIRDLLYTDHAFLVVPYLRVSVLQILAPINQVQNRILKWALALEKSGILGEGMTFSMEEKRNASSFSQTIYNNGTMNNAAALGYGSTAGVTVNDPAAFAKLIEGTGLNAGQRAEIIELFKQYHAAKEAEKPDLRARVLAFVGKYAKELAGAGVTIASALLAG